MILLIALLAHAGAAGAAGVCWRARAMCCSAALPGSVADAGGLACLWEACQDKGNAGVRMFACGSHFIWTVDSRGWAASRADLKVPMAALDGANSVTAAPELTIVGMPPPRKPGFAASGRQRWSAGPGPACGVTKDRPWTPGQAANYRLDRRDKAQYAIQRNDRCYRVRTDCAGQLSETVRDLDRGGQRCAAVRHV